MLKIPDGRPLDLAVVVDSSDDLSSDAWNTIISFTKNIIDSFPPSKNGTHIGFVTYGDEAIVNFNFATKRPDGDVDRDLLKSLIDTIKYQRKGDRRIDNALDVTNRNLFSQSGGSRPNARKVCFLWATLFCIVFL